MPVQPALVVQILHHGLHRVERQRTVVVQLLGDLPYPYRCPGRPDHVHDRGLKVTEPGHTVS
jgi:hypothetical protein